MPTRPSLSPSPTDFNSKLKEILTLNGINEVVSEIIVDDSGLKGEGMASIPNYVSVHFENESRPPLNLFVKQETSLLEGAKMFEKESLFFMKYLPAAKELCKSIGREKLMNIYPKCYYGDEKLVVFENLVVEKGYILLDKEKKQDFEAAKFSLITLAKHHALAHAMINKFGGPESFFKEFEYLKFESFLQSAPMSLAKPTFENNIATSIQLLQDSGLKNIDPAITKLNFFKNVIFNRFLDFVRKEHKSFCVLNHGDYWNNNMMFVKDETGQIKSHIAIDFQLTRYGPPSLDLSYYLFTSVKSDIRRKHLHDLLQIYLDELKSTASDLGRPINISFEELKNKFCENFEYGFFCANFFMSEVGMAVLKEMDSTSKTANTSEWAANMTSAVERWLKENPERATEIAQELIENLNEHDQLSKTIQSCKINN